MTTNIDCFLEQFKRSATKAMEERGSSATAAATVAAPRSRSFVLVEAENTTSGVCFDPPEMARVDAAEKEASEVLHSLLSVERIEKQEVIVVATGDDPSPTYQSNSNETDDVGGGEAQIQWHTPVSISTQSLYSTIDGNSHFPPNIEDQQVIWEGHTIQVEQDGQTLNNLYSASPVPEETPDSPKRPKPKTPLKNNKKKPTKKKKKAGGLLNSGSDPTKLEDSAVQVKERFKRGCECQDESCFRGLSPENVYKHRLNIAELTKGEHDMYLMGVTMACLANPDTTVRHKERRRLRAQYVYQGRRVCLDAFLYLENCTHYQLKRIRKHVMTHGVAPRVHGNHGKKPHNTFSLDIYRHATEFLKQYLETHTGETGIGNSKQPIQLPWDITRKNLHDAYKEYGQILEPGIKLMGYSTFRHFMKEQFPHVRFCKVEPKNSVSQQQNANAHLENVAGHAQNSQNSGVQQQIQSNIVLKQQQQQQNQGRTDLKNSVITGAEIQQVIPLVVAPPNDGQAQHHQQAFLVTQVPQLLPNDELMKNANEEFEMQTPVHLETLGVGDVSEVLEPQYAIITGGKSKDGCSLITFPDYTNFHLLTDIEYQRLMLYLTSVPSLQEADLGFHIIIDRRKDRWNTVKNVLLKISGYFPGLVNLVYVIRPASFLQKALSEVSNKLFKEEFKFRVIILGSVDELHEYVDVTQLTSDLGGTLLYCHHEWIQQRISLEKFSVITQEVSHALDDFTKTISETEFPNHVEATQQLLNQQGTAYSELKEEILTAAKHGESLLCTIRQKSCAANASASNHTPDTLGNVFAVERLLVQLEETERTFDEFWQQHSAKLRQCLELRRFEQDFRELQTNFESHLKTVSEMTEVGETVFRVDTLLRDTTAFQKLCMVDVERSEEVVSSGYHLMKSKSSCPVECVEPKCLELTHLKETLLEKLNRRTEVLIKYRDLMERVEGANKWCTKGFDMLTSQRMEKCSLSPELAEQTLAETEQFIASSEEFKLSNPKEFRNAFQSSMTPETKALVTQLLKRIDDVSLMCDNRMASLKKLTARVSRPVQTVNPEPAVPLQPPGGAPYPNKAVLRKANTLPKMEAAGVGHTVSVEIADPGSSPESDVCQDENNKAKRGHVLAELLDSERVYVAELGTILRGYKLEFESEDMQPLVPLGVADKLDVLFGNLDELYSFHSDMFLKDLENCISSTDLVALCFVQRRDMFFRLYSYYCQNIPRSEQLREAIVDTHMFFQACQQKLGHKLPLAAYLLKPVQRITKYQLLLKDLLRYSDNGKFCKELQQALDCMLVVLKCVNDSMHQIAITGFPVDLSQQGELLLQGSFSVWTENKRDLRLRLKPMQRHIFLYQKAMLFCKQASKSAHNKATYHFKHYLKMSQIGLTESVKGDLRKFEVWLQGRQEVHTIQAATVDHKQAWVNEIKRVLLNQLEELKGQTIKQYSSTLTHKPLRQTASWEKQQNISVPITNLNNQRTMSCDSESRVPVPIIDEEGGGAWSSDYSNSEDEDTFQQTHPATPSGRYVALADYCAVGNSEVNMREGDMLELLKVGCAGWWFVKVIGSSAEGWAPAAYLESVHRKTSRSSSRSQDRLNDH